MATGNGQSGLAYIHDGYMATAYIAGVDRLYPSVRIEYRPFGHREKALWQRGAANLDAIEFEDLVDRELANRIKIWDIKDSSGKAVAVHVNTLARIQPVLRDRLVGVVFGSQAPDVDPKAAADESRALAEDKFRGSPEGQTVLAGANGT